MSIRTFELVRDRDVSGVSGTGVVAEGAQFTDGSVALRWLGAHPSTAVWPSVAEVLAVHGHDGDTVARFIDEPSRGSSTVERIINALQRGADIGGNVSFTDSRAVIQTVGAAEWLQWLGILGGSPDAAVRIERTGRTDYPWEWSWTAPDNSVRVFYITDNPDEIELENG